jgi:hypothetical protein
MQPSDVLPRGFRTVSANVVELRSGGGCLALFGLPFLLVGIFVMLGALGLVPLNDEFSRPWTGTAPAAMGLAFLLPGAGLFFGRRSLTFDLAFGTVTLRYSAIVPLRTTQRQLSEFNAIVIGLQTGDSESVDRYPVQLRAIAGKDFTISSPTQFQESRQQAEFLSRLLRVPFADAITEHEVACAPEHAGETLQQRLRRQPLSRPAAPPAMRAIIDESPDGTAISIPRWTSPVSGTVAAILGLVVVLAIAPALWRVWSHSGMPPAARFLFIAFIVALFGIAPLVSAATAFGLLRNRVVVRVSPSALVIERQLALRTRVETTPAADILDIDYSTVRGRIELSRRTIGRSRFLTALANLSPNQGIVVKTRGSLIIFGESLRDEELSYLTWVIKKSLALSSDRA